MASLPAVPGTQETSPTAMPTAFLSYSLNELQVRIHTVLIVIIFSLVCFLLLLAFFYAFCFRCTIDPTTKDPQSRNKCSLDREDATFQRSSSPSMTNSI